MGIALVHDFHTKTSSVQDVSPSVDDTAISRLNGLIEVKTIQVKRHSRDTKSSEPDANHRPGCKEEVETTAVIKTSVLKDETPKVTMSSDDVIRLLFLSELIPIVMANFFSRFTNQRASNKGTMHS